MVRARKGLALVLLTALIGLGAPGTVWAQAQDSGATPAAPAAGGDQPTADAGALGDAEKGAIGCAVAGGGSMIGTYLAGPSEAIMLLGGGLLVPSASSTLALALLGSVGASTCAIGVTATPTVLWFIDQSGNIATKIAQATTTAGKTLWAALTGGGAAANNQLASAQQ